MKSARVTRGQITEQTRVLDTSVRDLRQRRQLEALEQDNFHEDPHANIVMAKNAPKFDDEEIFVGKKRKTKDSTTRTPAGKDAQSAKRRRKSRLEMHKTRFRKNFTMLHDEYNTAKKKLANEDTGAVCYMAYENARAPPPAAPPRKFCAVCGFKSAYNCVRCGAKYCSIRCRDVHNDTRCMKWTV